MSVQTAQKTNASHEGNGVLDEKRERADKIDFKMVTFALAGKEYGIDIMNVKEIAHAGKFTYVPNAAPFVRGVYNLRGDIISIIDLRTMFHLPSERKSEDALESLLILRVEDHVFGVIVDNIDKVVGVSSSGIQAPHPIFGDINVKYIKGIIENVGKLYIILNVEKLFAPKKTKDDAPNSNPMAAGSPRLNAVVDMTASSADSDILLNPVQNSQAGYDSSSSSVDLTSDFIKETLFAFKRFAVTAVNEAWFEQRYAEWKGLRKAMDLQLKEQGEADQFLETFFSPCTAELWSDDYANRVMASMPEFTQKSINVWNPGCGKGYETYSLVCALKKRFPDLRVKIWANDSDLLSISMAPNMVFMVDNVPELYKEYMVKGRNGWTFLQSIRDSIFFEFHDVLNTNPVPPVDILLCRDTVSFMSAIDQKRILADFNEKSKNGAALILGANETMPSSNWKRVNGDNVSVYIKGA